MQDLITSHERLMATATLPCLKNWHKRQIRKIKMHKAVEKALLDGERARLARERHKAAHPEKYIVVVDNVSNVLRVV